MQEIQCDNCGSSSVALDAFCVNVELVKHQWCDKCYHGNDQKTYYFFCSEACFLEYIQQVSRGEKRFDFDKYKRPYLSTQSEKRNDSMVKLNITVVS